MRIPVIVSMRNAAKPASALVPAIFAILLLSAPRAWADLSVEAGAGRDDGRLLMLTLFERGSPLAEWVSFQANVGGIIRPKRARLEVQEAPPEEVDDAEGYESFPFYGADIAIGHASLNPYILLIGGGAYFHEKTHRIGTNLNFHWALELGWHDERLGWFFRLHHWSNGQQITDASFKNLGEDMGSLGMEFRW